MSLRDFIAPGADDATIAGVVLAVIDYGVRQDKGRRLEVLARLVADLATRGKEAAEIDRLHAACRVGIDALRAALPEEDAVTLLLAAALIGGVGGLGEKE